MYILISLKKVYFDLMLEGKKKYEFRRKFLNIPCAAFLYISSPVSKVCGVAKLGEPIIESPQKISEIAKLQNLDADSDVMEYLQGLKVGYAVPIMNIRELKRPVTLEYLRNRYNFTAPQGYLILDKKPGLLGYLLKLTTRNGYSSKYSIS